LEDTVTREVMQHELPTVVASRGGTGASERAARLILGAIGRE